MQDTNKLDHYDEGSVFIFKTVVGVFFYLLLQISTIPVIVNVIDCR